MKTKGFIKLIRSVDANESSVMELNILPGEKTPWHYHSLFSETFQVIKGELEVGKDREIHQLKQGDIVLVNGFNLKDSTKVIPHMINSDSLFNINHVH